MQNTEDIRQYPPDFLPRAKKTGYICPVCGNGDGVNGDGIVLDRSDHTRTHYKCFKCGLYADVIDLIGLHYGIEDPKAKFDKAYEYFGVERPKSRRRREPGQGDNFTQNYTFTPGQDEDFTAFFLQAEQLNDFKYLQGRGISEATQRRFHIGFVPNWKSPQAVKTTLQRGGNPDRLPTSPRCIIPRSRFNYLARDTRDSLTDEQKKYEKQNTGRTSLFNADALKTSDTIFIVEGEIDAMSICESGGEAVGLCSVSNRGILITALKNNPRPGQAFILMLDNDEAGKRGTQELKEGLQRLGLPHVVADYPEGIKDPNQYLQEDPAGLQGAVSSLQAQALEAAKAAKGNEYAADDLLNYFRDIEKQPVGFEAKTGFERLDRELSGGLHEGLYIIGAVSSLGKTTFALQLADQIAQGGQDVIFFSLEMSKYELIAKSLSRHTYDIARNKKTRDGERPIARDTQQILNNRRYAAYTPEEKKVIADAIENYGKTQAPNISIYEGRYMGERLKVSHIREIVKNHIQTTGKKPVVFVDYLQIIAPEDPHATDKQNTDTNTFELKEVSRDFNIPVFAISSFNRENYLEPVSMTSFKESGAVEYSSDVLFGLQYAGMDYQDGDSEKARKNRLRDLMTDIYRRKREREPIVIELKCLKNRNGYQFSLQFLMMPAYNHFEAITEGAAVKGYEPTQKRRVL